MSVIVKILHNQQNTVKRQELINEIQNQLGVNSPTQMRKTFLYLCKTAVQNLTRQNFAKYFLKDYLSLANDKVPLVRIEFANSMLQIKPYLDYDKQLSMEIIDILNTLRGDSDRDVVEATEHTDYLLLQARKKSKEEEKEQLDLNDRR